jgi:hypothetical protein
MLVGVLILIGAAAAAVIVTSGTGGSTPPAKSPASNAPGPAATFDPSHVIVAVLNGTATNQLAHHVAERLARMGYKKGVIATASNQALTSTVVAYLGSTNRADAAHVAKALGLKRTAVQPINNAAKVVACPPPNTCTANVVVTVGTDLAGA